MPIAFFLSIAFSILYLLPVKLLLFLCFFILFRFLFYLILLVLIYFTLFFTGMHDFFLFLASNAYLPSFLNVLSMQSLKSIN